MWERSGWRGQGGPEPIYICISSRPRIEISKLEFLPNEFLSKAKHQYLPANRARLNSWAPITGPHQHLHPPLSSSPPEPNPSDPTSFCQIRPFQPRLILILIFRFFSWPSNTKLLFLVHPPAILILLSSLLTGSSEPSCASLAEPHEIRRFRTREAEFRSE